MKWRTGRKGKGEDKVSDKGPTQTIKSEAIVNNIRKTRVEARSRLDNAEDRTHLLSVGMAGHATTIEWLSETAGHLRRAAFRNMRSNQHGMAVFEVAADAASDWPSATWLRRSCAARLQEVELAASRRRVCHLCLAEVRRG